MFKYILKGKIIVQMASIIFYFENFARVLWFSPVNFIPPVLH
jgi:hypothetical protein